MISRVMVLSPTPVGPPIMMSVLIFFLRITCDYEITNLYLPRLASRARRANLRIYKKG
jgi:hypothetical protein